MREIRMSGSMRGGRKRAFARRACLLLYNPNAGLIRDTTGNLYGTASFGGSASAGVVFKLDKTGHETVLFNFASGDLTQAGLIRDSAGNLYGTTQRGGTSGHGEVFKLDTTLHETVLYSFTGGVDGSRPFAGVILDTAGNLYGTAVNGGASNIGVVFKVDTTNHQTVLYSFPGAADGAGFAGVIRDSAGNLYGTTFNGGTSNQGVVFKLDKTGHETVLYNFCPLAGCADGANPQEAPLTRDSSGNLYGTTLNGGASGKGVVFKLDTTNHETVLYSFTGGTDGGSPRASVILDSSGNLYGTTRAGGASGKGVVFKLDTTNHETVLYSFTGGTDGSTPSFVIRDSAGNLYGTTVFGGLSGCGASGCGVVFKLDTTGHETVLYSFTGGADGGIPYSYEGLVRDSAGNLYGTAEVGGASGCGSLGCGVVFKVDKTGHETVLYSFTGGADGANPVGGVIRDSTGDFYGTTLLGGTSGKGVVYKLDTTDHETVLHTFTGAGDGGTAYAGVIRDSAGDLYGTTNGGGATNSGVVFELKP
jgi:uncharacterized repeat protein (TIGR03803 family)